MGVTTARIGGHFGEFLQGRLGPEGPVVLVTLPCAALSVTALMSPARSLSIHGAGQRLLNPERARHLLRHLGLPVRGRVILRAAMPVGGGAGASTAALVALAISAGFDGPAWQLAAAAIRCEGASDPLMFAAPERHLWASRHGQSLRALPALPRFDVVGGFSGPPQRTAPKDTRFPDISDLIDPWVHAAKAADRAALARLAATSAERTLALRGGGALPLCDIARQTGALGYAIAHTGSARALLFAPDKVPASAVPLMRAAGCRQVIAFRTGGQP
jgi:uncharacterized protein involved in propanediol utilization